MTAPHTGESPAVQRMARVAEALGGDLCARVVFIGAAVLPLLETERSVLEAPRPTKDVDGVVGTTSYTAKARLEEAMRARQFRHDQTGHMDRWVAPDGTLFDLVGCGAHPGGTGNQHDQWAVDHAVEVSLPPTVRHASAVGWLLLKCGAYHDRGRAAPLGSKDLADIAALCATRPGLVEEVTAAPGEIRAAIGRTLRDVLADGRARGAVTSHIEDLAPLIPGVADQVLERIQQLAALDAAD